MCGRFTLHSRLNLLLEQFDVKMGPELTPRFNIAPTQTAPVVRSRADGQREIVLLRWGLVPSWAPDPSIGNRMINARAETVATKPSFRSALKHRRCLVPTDGYFEWEKKAGRAKQPYHIRLPEERPFAMAGLWEIWRDAEGTPLETFAIITTNANAATREIHDRMPVILSPAQYPVWLDPDCDQPAALQPLLHPYSAGPMEVAPVSTYVNSPRHDDPQCIARS